MKVLCLGLDGATWDILTPLIADGKMPNLNRLMKNGVYGELESTIPPVTGPAWVSMATGKNPGKTGVFDFINKKDDTNFLHPATSKDFQNGAFWDYVSSQEKGRVGIVNYPMLFPVYKINGFMVSNVAFSGNEDIAYPKDLKEKLSNLCNGYENAIQYHHKRYDNLDIFIRDLKRVMNKQLTAFRYFLKEDWKLLVYVLSTTDWVQHIMWKHLDENHPYYDKKVSPQYKKEFIKFWQQVDIFLKEVTEIHEDINIILVSDHGFGTQDECFNLFKWLKIKGYLVMKTKKSSFSSIRDLLTSQLSNLGTTSLRRLLPEKFVRAVRKNVMSDITKEIDFEKSEAFVLGHTIPFGAIYLKKDIKTNSNSKKLKERLESDLKNLSEDIGQNITVKIFEAVDIYTGEHTEKAPDIIFTIDNWRCIINETRPDEPLFKNEPYSIRHTGSHRMNGVFLAYGPDIKKGIELKSVRIYDIAPTILHMFNLSIPKDMDGRVLKEIFEKHLELTRREIKHDKSEEKKEDLKEKIRNLKLSGKI